MARTEKELPVLMRFFPKSAKPTILTTTRPSRTAAFPYALLTSQICVLAVAVTGRK